MQVRTVNVGSKRSDTVMPVSSATIAGNLVFTSGHVGWPLGTHEASPGIEAQTVQALENLKAVLHAAGTSLAHVAKVNIYLRNIEDFAAMNGVYNRYFASSAPARTTLGIADLADPGLLIEIEMIAVLPDSAAQSPTSTPGG